MYCQMCEVHINEAVRTACNADKVISDRRRNETKVIADDLDTSAVMGAIRSLGYDTDGFSVHPYRKNPSLIRSGEEEMIKESESRRTYLKTILELRKDGARVRNSDIAKALSYSRPSVTNAVKKLIAEGFAQIDDIFGIILTEKGLDEAEKLVERNRILTQCFLRLGAEESVAKENAYRLEFIITDELFEAISRSIFPDNGKQG